MAVYNKASDAWTVAGDEMLVLYKALKVYHSVVVRPVEGSEALESLLDSQMGNEE